MPNTKFDKKIVLIKMLGKFLKLTPILTLFIFANANAQFEKVGGHWENEDSLRMGIRAESSGNYIITNPTNRFNFLDNNRRFSVRILGDTLRLLSKKLNLFVGLVII